ncbi:MAG TPA: hypothetical protein VFW07_28870 [Parafilimonas sp.]|nr:hypothetical protein [Parafilimonas sp.]
MKTNFGIPLNRDQMKTIKGGYMMPPGCAISATCSKSTYNFQAKKWESTAVATVSCTGSGNCTGSINGVSCEQSGGTTDTSTCPPGSAVAT